MESFLIHSHREILPISKIARLGVVNIQENETDITIKNNDTPDIEKVGISRISLNHWRVWEKFCFD